MSCESCRKKIKPNEEIVLVGKYPKHRARAQIEGEIYHKTCFLQISRKEAEAKRE